MELKELFEKMATRAGIAKTDAKLVATLELIPAGVDVDDEAVANLITKNLITEAEVLADQKVKGRFTAEALNGIDSLIEPVLADFLDAAEIESLKGDKMTTKKLNKLFEKAKAAKAASGNSAETAKALSDLNAEITRLKTDKETEIGTLKTQHQRERFEDKLVTKVLGRADVIDTVKSFDGLLAIKALEKKIEKEGGQIDYTTGKLVQKADTTMPLFVDHKEATIDGLLDAALKENDYIKKSDGPAPSTIVPVPGGGGGDNQISEAQRQNAERMAKMN